MHTYECCARFKRIDVLMNNSIASEASINHSITWLHRKSVLWIDCHELRFWGRVLEVYTKNDDLRSR